MTKFQKQMLTIAAAGAMSAITALPAMAAQADIYGSIRLDSFFNSVTTSENVKQNGSDLDLRNDSRLGVIVKNDAFKAVVELGIGDNNTANTTTMAAVTAPASATGTAANTKDNNSVTLRLMYGQWDFGQGVLTVGQDFTPYTALGGQVHGATANIYYGATYDGRLPMLRVDLKNGLFLALIKPNGDISGSNLGMTSAGAVRAYLPKVAVGYTGKAGNVNYKIGVAGQTQTLDSSTYVGDTVKAYLAYLQATAVFGDTTLKTNLTYAQNPFNFGLSNRLGYDTAHHADVKGYEGYIQAEQKINKDVSVIAGFGYVQDENKFTNKTDARSQFYVNAPIQVAKNLKLIPEFVRYDQLGGTVATAGTLSTTYAKQWSAGAQWRYDF